MDGGANYGRHHVCSSWVLANANFASLTTRPV